jgi:hypothetical protein
MMNNQFNALFKQLSATQQQMLINRMQMIAEYNSGNRSNLFTVMMNNAVVFKGNSLNDALDTSSAIEKESLQQIKDTGKTSTTSIIFATTRTGDVFTLGKVSA